MSKKSRFRGCCDKQYGKRAKALLKYGWKHLYRNHLSLVKKSCSNKSLLLTWQILGLLSNTLATDEKYRVLKRDNLTIPIQIQLSHKQKTFSQIFAPFLKSRLFFKDFQLKADPDRFCIFEVTDSKIVVRSRSKRSRFRGCFEKEYGKRTQAMLKSASENLYHIHWSLTWNFCSRNSLLLTCQILGLLVNTLAIDEKYPVLNRDNLNIPIQMQLSEKQETFSEFLDAFLKSRFNFEHFQKKMPLIDFVFSKLRTPKA